MLGVFPLALCKTIGWTFFVTVEVTTMVSIFHRMAGLDHEIPIEF